MLWDGAEVLIEEVLEAIVIRLDDEAAPPQVRPPVPDREHKVDGLPLVRCKGWRGATGRLKKATGCASCMSTAPKPYVDASHSTVKGLVKSDKVSTGADITAALRALNAAAASSFHVNPSLRSVVRGAAMAP